MNTLRELWTVFALLLAAGAWISFAEHPTACRLRVAIADTLGL
jgi:hypothetical protein